jgi:hypothetical protein
MVVRKRSTPFGFVAFAAVCLVLSSAACAPQRGRTVSDGVLRIAVPGDWSDSIGPGVQSRHSVAWILVGNFSFLPEAAKNEGTPAVPRGKVLISVGDFVPEGSSLRWPRVNRLHLPRPQPGLGRLPSWHVRFADRALWLNVIFGSTPNAQMKALAERVLDSTRRQR